MLCKGAAAQGVRAMLGIDVSKATLAYSLLAAGTQQVVAAGQVPNTPAGIAQLAALAPAEHPWVLEPTGVYSRAVVQRAQQDGRTVLLAPPKEAKAFLAVLHPRAKTDRLDSQGLAHYALALPLRPFPVKAESVVQLEQLLAARKGLSESLPSSPSSARSCRMPPRPWPRRSRRCARSSGS